MNKLKIGFLVDSLNVDYYVWDLIYHIKKNDLFEEPILITGYKKKSKKLFYGKNIFRSILETLIKKIEYRFVNYTYPNYGKKINLENEDNLKKIFVEGQWSKSNGNFNFTDNDVKKISLNNLDCIIKCDSGINTEKILNITSLGILFFYYRDNRCIGGGPNGFWEVLNNHPSSGFTILKIDEEPCTGDVLLRGNIVTEKFWLLNHAQVLEKSNFFFKEILNKIAINKKIPIFEKKIPSEKKILSLGTIDLTRYFFKILFPKILEKVLFLKKIDKIFGKKVERWNIAYSINNDHKMSLSKFKVVKNLKNSFFADPFVFKKDGLNYVFVENYNYSKKKATISALCLKDDKYEYLGNVIDESFHLSFPFIFRWEKGIYMIPETHKAKQIRLYKCQSFPMKWKLDQIIMKNVIAADTMILRKNKKWFMFTNICSAGLKDLKSELHIFYSENLNSENWKPIKSGNPVIFDSMSARNGGFFFKDDNLYRINQIHEKNHYGKSFGINKIQNLSEESYHEIRVKNVDPTFKKNIISTHHFSADDNLAAVDFCIVDRI